MGMVMEMRLGMGIAGTGMKRRMRIGMGMVG